MRWRDIRFEKPTEADKASGHIIQKLQSGRIFFWPAADIRGCVAWMPLSELPQPDLPGEIPDGWRAVDKWVDAFDTRSMFWLGGKWQPTQAKLAWDRDYYYIVLITEAAK